MPKLILSEPFLLTPLTEHVSLHEGQGHIGLTKIVQDLGVSSHIIKVYPTPMPEDRQLAYAEGGYGWEDALEAEFKRRQGIRMKKANSKLILQHKMCVEGVHMIPDGHIPKVEGHEYKQTFKQMCEPEDLLDVHWAWKMQTQAYAHNLKVYDWHFYVCWLNRWPQPYHYHFKYDKKECANTWKNLMQHRELMRKRTSAEI